MTLEELQAENSKLKADLTALKASVQLDCAQAAKDEQTRILGILAAADTLKCSFGIAKKRILANTTIEDATSMFEDIQESIQLANPVDIETNQTTLAKGIVPAIEGEASFLQSFETALETIDKQEKSDNAGWGNI